jgi:hypothetical protein
LQNEGRVLIESKSWPDAVRTWQKVLSIAPRGTWGEDGQKQLSAAQEALAGEVDRVSKLLVPGHAADGYKQLGELDKQCAGLPIDKDIKTRLAKAEAAKDIRAEIATYKLGLEADALLREAQSFLDQKQDKKGEHAARRLLAKRFASTEAAAKARELWPDWAKEEDAKTNKP